ncbi:putative ABC transport system permease protein [Catalinimonas alkaloidigena]|uniref:Putative ABC transport system permease protein n=1 Tax=Catalinimonas alkaloidigena TaxID=1075417 RepID=A0A1G9KN97_9BACT|nr:ABC transporter permease [Catalinimonas alkaloidigena]SDL51238.1 putative ABC transport system permease protein [Catalinimonas alkaloidigena]
MWYTELRAGFRALFKQKGFALINLLGLGLALSAFLLIGLYTSFQWSIDAFHQHHSTLYAVHQRTFQHGELLAESNETYQEVGPLLQQHLPGVVNMTRVTWPLEQLVQPQHTAASEVFTESQALYVDSSFLLMFTFPLVAGDADRALTQPHSVVLTEATAQKYFGEQSPLGKTLLTTDAWGSEVSWTVTGVAHEVPAHSSLQFDLLFASRFEQDTAEMVLPDYQTFVQLAETADPQATAAKLDRVVLPLLGRWARAADRTLALSLLPLEELYFDQHPDRREAVAIATGMALLILMIAWINFVNVAVVQSLDRAKGIGVRKVIGASTGQLRRQHIGENLALHGLALLLALGGTLLVRPWLSGWVPLHGPASFSVLSAHSLAMFGFWGVGTLGAIFYVAWVTSSYELPLVVKGKYAHTRNRTTTRKVLVVVQFASAFLLMAGALVMYRQLQFMRNAPLGINLEQTLVLKAPKRHENKEERYSAFKAELLRQTAVQAVSSTSIVPGRDIGHQLSFRRQGADEAMQRTLAVVVVDPNFVPAFAISLRAGRNFSEGSWKSWPQVLLNEAAAQALGFAQPEEAIAQQIVDQTTGKALTVIGVVPNYHQKSLKQAIVPLVYRFQPNSWGYCAIKLRAERLASPQGVQQVMDQIAQVWQASFEDEPFDYFFLDAYFNAQYEADEQVNAVVTGLTLLALVIAGIGLFGLASYAAMQRTKEMGIRKVCGASVGSLLWLQTKNYLQLVLLAILITIPIANYGLQQWLQQYAFHLEVGGLFWLVPGLALLAVAWAAVVVQAAKAARTNPVESLRHE